MITDTQTIDPPAEAAPPATIPAQPAARPELIEWRKQDAAIKKLAQDYLPLTIAGIDDKKGLAAVHAARMEVKGFRVQVEKQRVKLKAEALAYGKAVDAEAHRLTALLEPIEEHLEAQESAVVKERERIKAEEVAAAKAKIHQRFQALQAAGFAGNFMSVPEMTDAEFAAVITKAEADTAERDRLAEEERQRREAEQERLRKLEAEGAELRRKKEAEEAERRRQIEAQAAEQRRAEGAALAAERKRLDEEKARQDAEAERLAEERRQVELERARQEAAERARVETAERLKREAAEREAEAKRKAAQEKAEAEARELARLKAEAERPQREKFLAIAAQLREIGADVCDQPNKQAANDVVRILDIAEDSIRKVAEKLA